LSQPRQFSGWPSKAYSYKEMGGGKQAKLKWADSYLAAIKTLTGSYDPTGGADHFYSPWIDVPGWAKEESLITPRGYVDYVINVRVGTQYFHGASFLFFDLVDDNGHWR